MSEGKLNKLCAENGGEILRRLRKGQNNIDKNFVIAKKVVQGDKLEIGIGFKSTIDKEIISKIFDVLSECTKVVRLRLLDIPFIPKELGKIKKLEQLMIDSDYVTELVEEISDLQDLKRLSLRLKNIQEFPKCVLKLNKLEILDLCASGISEIPEEINCLKKIRVLDLSCMNLRKIPHTILDLQLTFIDFYYEHNKRDGIYICDTVCQSPPTDILYGGRKRIELYYNGNEKVKQNEVRVILLGKKAAGKTSLVERIMEIVDKKSYYTRDKVYTKGVSIKKVETEREGVLHLWDFGGQDILLSTHTLFLRDHCIYIILLNARQGDQPYQWLDYISQYGQNSTIFIVNNHMDEADNERPDINKIKRLYPDITHSTSEIWEISCDKPEEFPIEPFYEKLTEESSKWFDREVPLAWKKLSQKLSDLKESGKQVNYISHDIYMQTCQECGIIHTDEKLEVLRWLNDIGVVFTYGNIMAIDYLNEFKVLRPKWVTDAIYKIIDSVKTQKEQCLVSHEEIEMALTSGTGENGTTQVYTFNEVCFILDVMHQFGLSFQYSDSTEFIPSIAADRNEPKTLADWTKEFHENLLDVVFEIKQNNNTKWNKASVDITQLYQVIIKIVKNCEIAPPIMWSTGAFFAEVDGMQALLFLQDYSSWKKEMRLIIKSIKQSQDATNKAAVFFQKVLYYLKECDKTCKVDAKVLVNGSDNSYFSVESAQKIVINNKGLEYYDPQIDQELNLYEDVIRKITPESKDKLLKQIANILNSSESNSDLYLILNQIIEKTGEMHNELSLCKEKIHKIDNRDYAFNQSMLDIQQKVQSLVDSANGDEKRMEEMKGMIQCLQKESQSSIGEKLLKVIDILSMLISFGTADYSQLADVIKTIKIFLKI